MVFRNDFPVVDTVAVEAMAAVVAIVGWMVVMVEVAVAIAVQVVATVMVVAIVVDMGKVIVALFIPLSTWHKTLSIQCVYLYNATL